MLHQTKALSDKLLLEKLPLAGIDRVSEVSQTGLQSYVNQKYEQVSKPIEVRSKKSGCDPAIVEGGTERLPSRDG